MAGSLSTTNISSACAAAVCGSNVTRAASSVRIGTVSIAATSAPSVLVTLDDDESTERQHRDARTAVEHACARPHQGGIRQKMRGEQHHQDVDRRVEKHAD